MTQLLVSKSAYVLKKVGGWGCGSEQVPLMKINNRVLPIAHTLKCGKCNFIQKL